MDPSSDTLFSLALHPQSQRLTVDGCSFWIVTGTSARGMASLGVGSSPKRRMVTVRRLLRYLRTSRAGQFWRSLPSL